MKNVLLKLTLCFLFICSFLLLTPNGAQAAGKLNSGNYQPGAVLIYKGSSWQIATPDDVDYSENNYVFVHGAFSSGTNQKTQALARAILSVDSDANVFVVDWCEFASFNGDRLADIVGEQVDKFAAEYLVATGAREFIKWLGDLDDDDVPEIDTDEMIGRHLQELVQRVLLNVMPVEQTKYIPDVADRAESLLFGDRGDEWKFTTNGESASFIALGLNPKKTHLIGHSHGAHIAGLICAYCQKETGKMVKRLTALDPSPAELQISDANKNGNGWSKNVADLVDVYRMSLLCSSDKLYGDVNLHLADSQHPLLQMDEAESDEAKTKCLTNGLAHDIELHTRTVDAFLGLIQIDDDFLLNGEKFLGDGSVDVSGKKWDIVVFDSKETQLDPAHARF